LWASGIFVLLLEFQFDISQALLKILVAFQKKFGYCVK